MLNLNTLRFGHVAQPTHSARQPLRFAATADLVQFGNDKKVNPEAQADTEVEAEAEAEAEAKTYTHKGIGLLDGSRGGSNGNPDEGFLVAIFPAGPVDDDDDD